MTRAARAVLVVVLLASPNTPACAQEIGLEPVLTGVDFPTNLAFSADGRVFFTEKDTGRIRVVRIRAEGDTGTDVEPVIDLLPWVRGYHNGGDLAFDTRGALFISVGEAHEPGRAQDPNDLGGKILRIAPDGTVPEDNPTTGSHVYALGVRNSFGLCVDPTTGDLWETENGPNAFDEVNLIEPGGNHGWPDQLGPSGEPTYVDPVLAFADVIVPTGCAVTEGGSTLCFGTYGGEIRRLTLPPGGEPRDTVVATTGAVTDVARAPDGSIWVATSDAIYRVGDLGAGGSPSPAASETAATRPTGRTDGSVPSASPSPDTARDPLSPATVVIALVLLGGLYLARRRMGGGR